MSPAILLVLLVQLADTHKLAPTDRLEIDKPTKGMKVTVEQSDKWKGEEYDLVIDEEEVKKIGLTPKEIRETLKAAMDSRNDRREDGAVVLETDGQEEIPRDGKIGPPAIGPKKLFAKIVKRSRPKGANQIQPGKTAQKLDKRLGVWVTSAGACTQQNEALRDAVQLPFPIV